MAEEAKASASYVSIKTHWDADHGFFGWTIENRISGPDDKLLRRRLAAIFGAMSDAIHTCSLQEQHDHWTHMLAGTKPDHVNTEPIEIKVVPGNKETQVVEFGRNEKASDAWKAAARSAATKAVEADRKVLLEEHIRDLHARYLDRK